MYAVSLAVPQPVLGSCRPLASCSLVRGVSSGSPVVGCSSGSPHRFRPLGLGAGFSVHQRQRAAGHPAQSPPLSVVSARTDGRGLLRQRHCGGVSPQGGRLQVSLAEHHCQGILHWSESLAIRLAPQFIPGYKQRPGGRSVSPSPAAAFRVVPQHDRVSVFVSSVAGADRFICDLRKSPLLDLFFSLSRPSVGGHGRLPPVLGRSSGFRLSSVCHHSKSPCETPGVSGDGAHPCGSALGTAPLVFLTSSSSRWPLRSSSQIVLTSCSCLDLDSATRVSTGYGFMPGDSGGSPELQVCSDRILTCRIKSIRSPAKVGLVVTDLITSPVVSWEGWETPPPPQHRGSAVILCSTTGVVRPLCSCGDLLLSSARLCLRFGGC